MGFIQKCQIGPVRFESYKEDRDAIIAKNATRVLLGQITENMFFVSCDVLNFLEKEQIYRK